MGHQVLLISKINVLVVTKNDRMKVRSIGGYLNSLLSFSSSSAVSNDFESGYQIRHDVENGVSEFNNNDYFFHDDIPGSDISDGMNYDVEAARPDFTPPENKNSSSNLIRRKSFT